MVSPMTLPKFVAIVECFRNRNRDTWNRDYQDICPILLSYLTCAVGTPAESKIIPDSLMHKSEQPEIPQLISEK